MEALWVLVAVGLLAAPVVGLILAIVALSRTGELDQRVQRLSRRVAHLENSGAAGWPADAAAPPEPAPYPEHVAPPEPAPAPVPPPGAWPIPGAVPVEEPEAEEPELEIELELQPTPSAYVPPMPEPEPVATMAEPVAPVAVEQKIPPRDLSQAEAVVGGKWSLWVGVILVLFAASFGIAYGWQFIGEAGRVALGVLAGLIFLGLGEWSRGRGSRWFNEGLTAGGIALLYLSIWAATMRYGIVSGIPAFVLMSAITAACVALSVRQDAPSLIIIASLGGYLTPVLLDDGQPGEGSATLFGVYVTVLNAGVLGTAAFKRWREVQVLAFIAAVLLIGGWLSDVYRPFMLWETFVWLTVNFAMFMGIATVYPLRFQRPAHTPELVLLFGASTAYFLAGMAIFPASPALDRGLFALALAALQGALGFFAFMRSPDDEGMIWTGLGLSAAFLTIACPLIWGGHPLVMAWGAEAAILALVGLRIRRDRLIWAGAAVLGLSAIALVFREALDSELYSRVLFNPMGATLLVLIASSTALSWIAGKRVDQLEMPAGLVGALAVLGGVLVFWLIGRETYQLFATRDLMDPHQAQAAWLVLLALCAVAARGMVWGASWPHLRPLGSLGLGVLAAGGALALLLGIASLDYEWSAFINLRLMCILVFAACVASLRVESEQLSGVDPTALRLVPVWAWLLVTFGLSQEIYSAMLGAAFPTLSSCRAAAWLLIGALWAASGALGVSAGRDWRNDTLHSICVVLWAAGVIFALATSMESALAGWQPLGNLRVLSFLVICGASAALAWLEAAAARAAPERGDLKPLPPAVFGVVGAFAGLWLLTQETFHLFIWYEYPSVEGARNAAHLSVSVVWTLYAAVWMWIGLVREHRLPRWLSLGLLGAALLKLFVYDLGFLELPYRMVSFGVLGGILIAVAWLYSKFGDVIIGRPEDAAPGDATATDAEKPTDGT